MEVMVDTVLEVTELEELELLHQFGRFFPKNQTVFYKLSLSRNVYSNYSMKIIT